MKTRVKLALTTLTFLASVALLSLFFDWMNRPSDLWFWLGAVGVLKVLVLAPALIAVIWRPRLLRDLLRRAI